MRARRTELAGSAVPLDFEAFADAAQLFGLDEESGVRLAALGYEKWQPHHAVVLWLDWMTQRMSGWMRELEDSNSDAEPLDDGAQSLIWRRAGDLLQTAGEALHANRHCDCFHCTTLRDLGIRSLDPASCYERAVELDPDDRETAIKAVQALVDDGRQRDAEKLIDTFLERSPDDVSLLTRMGELLTARAVYRKALRYLRRARDLDPLGREVREAVEACHLESARRRIRSGKLHLARQDVEVAQALELPPPRPAIELARAALECADGAFDDSALERLQRECRLS